MRVSGRWRLVFHECVYQSFPVTGGPAKLRPKFPALHADACTSPGWRVMHWVTNLIAQTRFLLCWGDSGHFHVQGLTRHTLKITTGITTISISLYYGWNLSSGMSDNDPEQNCWFQFRFLPWFPQFVLFFSQNSPVSVKVIGALCHLPQWQGCFVSWMVFS